MSKMSLIVRNKHQYFNVTPLPLMCTTKYKIFIYKAKANQYDVTMTSSKLNITKKFFVLLYFFAFHLKNINFTATVARITKIRFYHQLVMQSILGPFLNMFPTLFFWAPFKNRKQGSRGVFGQKIILPYRFEDFEPFSCITDETIQQITPSQISFSGSTIDTVLCKHNVLRVCIVTLVLCSVQAAARTA